MGPAAKEQPGAVPSSQTRNAGSTKHCRGSISALRGKEPAEALLPKQLKAWHQGPQGTALEFSTLSAFSSQPGVSLSVRAREPWLTTVRSGNCSCSIALRVSPVLFVKSSFCQMFPHVQYETFRSDVQTIFSPKGRWGQGSRRG